MGKISRKAHLYHYKNADSSRKEIYQKLVSHDIINAFNFIRYRDCLTIQKRESEIVKNVIDSQDFSAKLDLLIRLSEAAHAIDRLEKHFDKLAGEK